MKKYIAGFMLFGVLMFSAPLAQAVTVEDLYKEIKSLKEEVNFFKNQLKGEVLGDTTTQLSTTVLTKGTKGEEVSVIQSALKKEGYIIPVVDGIFGSITEAAVKAYQQASGLPATGVVDILTKTSIVPITTEAIPTDGVNYMDGCNATTKYSATNGRACDGSQEIADLNLLPGCTSNTRYSATTGKACDVVKEVDSDVVKIDTCNQTAPGMSLRTLDSNSPGEQNVLPGANDVILAVIKISNIGNQDICYLNGLQIGSNTSLNSYLTNVRVVDLSDGSKVGQKVSSFGFNGSSYVTWVSDFDLPIKINSSKTFKIIGDIKSSAPDGDFQFGLFGINHSGGFGASGGASVPLLGSRINIAEDIDTTQTCATGYSGVYPNCTLIVVDVNPDCPQGTMGTYPNCTTITGDFPAGCSSNSGFSATTGMACSSGSHLISYWWGKVNQHTNPGLNNVNLNKWETDPDGVSGADLDKLTYCKKWFPNTTAVTEFMNQTLVDWKERGNVNNWTSVKMAYKCVQ